MTRDRRDPVPPPMLLIHGAAPPRGAFVLRPGRNVIGRARECGIHLLDASVSRTHAEVVAKNGTLVLRDLGSQNGTFVNGKRVNEITLAVGDELQVGHVRLDVVDAARSATRDDDEPTERSSGRLDIDQVASARTLSEAQRAVLQLLLEGLSEKEVAGRLGISPHTVHIHVGEIFRKLDVHARAELMALYIRNRGH